MGILKRLYGSLIFDCARKGFTRAIPIFVRLGGSVEKTVEGMTPLLIAAVNNQSNAVRVLVGAGANLEQPDSTGRSPLACAVARRAFDAAEELLKSGASLHWRNTEGYGLLHLAVLDGDIHTVRWLLDKGVNANDVEPATGGTPLMLACSRSKPEVVKALLEGGADVELMDRSGHDAIAFAHTRNDQAITALVTTALPIKS
jgi:ankyrin repeat protein